MLRFLLQIVEKGILSLRLPDHCQILINGDAMGKLRTHAGLCKRLSILRQAVGPDHDTFLLSEINPGQGADQRDRFLQQTIGTDHGIRIQVEEDPNLRILCGIIQIHLPLSGSGRLLPVDGTIGIHALIIPEPPEGQGILDETPSCFHLTDPAPGNGAKPFHIQLLRKDIDPGILLPIHGKQTGHEKVSDHDIYIFHLKMSPLISTKGKRPLYLLMSHDREHIIPVIIIRHHRVLHIKDQRPVHGKLKMKYGQGQGLVILDLFDQLCLLPAFHKFLTKAKRSPKPLFPILSVQALLDDIYNSDHSYDQNQVHMDNLHIYRSLQLLCRSRRNPYRESFQFSTGTVRPLRISLICCAVSITSAAPMTRCPRT